jgi:hypothetical protein
MATEEGPYRTGDSASRAELTARYRSARTRLMSRGHAGPTAAPPTSQSRPRTRRRRARWLPELIAFNEDLRRLFLRTSRHVALRSGEKIRDVVASHYGITFSEIVGESAIRRCAWPRQVAMYICARHAGLSFTHIGRLFGDRDPKTIRFAVRAIDARMRRDPALAAEIPALIEASGLGGAA